MYPIIFLSVYKGLHLFDKPFFYLYYKSNPKWFNLRSWVSCLWNIEEFNDWVVLNLYVKLYGKTVEIDPHSQCLKFRKKIRYQIKIFELSLSSQIQCSAKFSNCYILNFLKNKSSWFGRLRRHERFFSLYPMSQKTKVTEISCCCESCIHIFFCSIVYIKRFSSVS